MIGDLVKSQVSDFVDKNADLILQQIAEASDPIITALYSRGLKVEGIRSHFENLIKHIIDGSTEQLAAKVAKSDAFSKCIADAVAKQLNSQSSNIIKREVTDDQVSVL